MNRKNRIIWLTIFLIVNLVLWNFDFGYYVLYPFTILGTWFHEMAHGIMAMFMGADFTRLQLFPNGSGVAQFSYSSLFLGRFGNALIAAAGPIGPTIAGAMLFYSSVSLKWSKIMLFFLSFIMFVSIIVWVRPIFSIGAFVILLLSIIFAWSGLKLKNEYQSLILQFLGIQSFASVYMSIGYLFSSGGNIGGSSFSSDTQVIADNLLLPYWFWAFLLLAFSIFTFYKSSRYILSKN